MAITIIPGNNGIDHLQHVVLHRRIRVFIDRYRRGGMGDKHHAESVAHTILTKGRLHVVGDVDHFGAGMGFHRQDHAVLHGKKKRPCWFSRAFRVSNMLLPSRFVD